MNAGTQRVGDLLRDWRMRRRLSQLDLAFEAGISTRHLSFIETGRSTPSREMILHLAEELEIPLRERNTMLLAAGYAPAFKERSLQDPSLDAARNAVEQILKGHEPYPALAVDRHWNLITSNRAATAFIAAADSTLLSPPLNVLRLSLHPKGMAPAIRNFPEWRGHLLLRLKRQIEVTRDPDLEALYRELSAYPVPGGETARLTEFNGIAIPLQLATEHGTLSFLSTTTVFGTPVDITLSELALETFFPADPFTSETLLRINPAV